MYSWEEIIKPIIGVLTNRTMAISRVDDRQPMMLTILGDHEQSDGVAAVSFVGTFPSGGTRDVVVIVDHDLKRETYTIKGEFALNDLNNFMVGVQAELGETEDPWMVEYN